ncbi:MAG: methylglutaconyl-CoA hydratase [Leptospiraceae bacterium]|nr:MAG: methylglutaconyl-CoA hydratase [Leptospiraceae bacterium]
MIFTIILNRPNVHNALNEEMILELNTILEELKKEDFKILIIRGEGKSFCSGADLNYMKKMKHYTLEENKNDALQLAELMYNIYTFPKPTISIGHGSIMGGGIGLIACTDFSLCEKESKFAFSEVLLGLIPAVISPYIIRKMGFSKTKELFLTGRIFNSEEAEKWGLITKSLDKMEMDNYLHHLIKQLLKSSPNAIKEIKHLMEINLKYDLENLKHITSEIIAKLRITEEAQEGISAFFEKRKPQWYNYEDK